jgi:amino acid transporter
VNQDSQRTLVRAIGRWSLAALLVNSIIGSGIFGLPSIVAGLVGRASPLAYLIAAAGVGVIMACFAEVASQFRETGGPYLYARAAFGQFLGIQVGWLTGLARLTATAGNANLFVIYLAEFWPRAKEPLPRAVVIALLLGILGAVNYRGVRAGAQLSNFFTVAKLLPLFVFLAVGLFFLLTRRSEAAPFSVVGGTGAWLQAVLLLVYSYGGFEGAIIVTGEATNPRRDAPFAFFVALATITTVYTLVQVVVVGTIPNPAATDRPLATAARQFLGSGGATLMALSALVAVYGILSSMTLYTPRLAFAFAEQKDLPRILAAVHPRFRTPHVAIVIYCALSILLAVAGTFRWNITLSAVARLFTYSGVCATLLVLRKKNPGASAFRLPVGPVLAYAGIAFSAVLMTKMGRAELIIVVLTVAIAFLNWLWARRPDQRAKN